MVANKEQVQFLKGNLRLMLTAKSVDEVVGMVNVLLNYVEHICPEPLEVWLAEPGNIQNKIACIKEIRGITGLGLKESKDLVEQSLNPIYRGENVETALALQRALKPYARVEIKGASKAVKILFGDK